MAHFAKLDSDNNVIHVSVVDNDVLIDEFGNESENLGIQHLTKVHGYSNWKQTSYHGNFRGCYASKGYKYDPELDIFIQPQPFPYWKLNKSEGVGKHQFLNLKMENYIIGKKNLSLG